MAVNPIAVVISDIHYNMQTLEVADKCLRLACEKAKELGVTLIIAGDLHDTKANLRGECMNRMIATLGDYINDFDPYILRGNHDALNEKSEEHSLGFLQASCNPKIITYPVFDTKLNCWFIPYQHDPEEMQRILHGIKSGSRLIIHQGRHGALPGGYSFDKSALPASAYEPFKVISGHYHQHQSFGNFTYIGNPYSLDFSEASHPDKGFIILNDDFSITRVPTNVRKHIVININLEQPYPQHLGTVASDDLVLVKLTGPQHKLLNVKKDIVQKTLGLTSNFRLDLIPLESIPTIESAINHSATELFNSIIDNDAILTDAEKQSVKSLWQEYSK